MLPFASMLRLNAGSSQAIYIQMANGITRLIQSGVLKPGSKLPSIREMAKQLKLNPNTIVAAYEEMMTQGWIYSKPRSGVIISENLPELKPKAFRAKTAADPQKASETVRPKFQFKYVINDGFPDYRLAVVDQLLRCYKNVFHHGQTERFSMFTDPAGSLRLQVALSKYINESRAIKAGPNHILTTRGAQMALYVAAGLLIKPGDHVMVGEPGYATANDTFEKFGAKLIRIPVDEKGIDVQKIEKALKKHKPKLLYIIPHHHHPTTVTLSAARRMKLLSLVREHKFHILEDDYDYEFHYNRSPILPLASADHDGHVLYIGSVTKNLTSSLRIGYLVAPAEIISRAVDFKTLIDPRGDQLLDEALATLYENGTMQRHIRKSVRTYHKRRDLLCDLLKKELGDKISFKKPDGGMAVWIKFNKKYSLPKIASLAAAKSLCMKDGSFYNTSNVNHNALRLGFASLDESEIVNVVRILKEVVQVLS